MKRSIALIVWVVLVNFTGHSQQPKAQKKVVPSSSKFVGKWKGTEMCADISAPVALLFIAGNGPEVSLTGIYSIQGQVKAELKGDTLVIPRQEVKDPNFKNLIIEGKLGYGSNPVSLSGKITVLNNQKKDDCAVKYYK